MHGTGRVLCTLPPCIPGRLSNFERAEDATAVMGRA